MQPGDEISGGKIKLQRSRQATPIIGKCGDRIHELLRSDAEMENRIDTVLPFFQLEEPLIIAEEHRDWYLPQRGVRDYYWTTYLKYLKERRQWNEASLLDMDNSTRALMRMYEFHAMEGLLIMPAPTGVEA